MGVTQGPWCSVVDVFFLALGDVCLFYSRLSFCLPPCAHLASLRLSIACRRCGFAACRPQAHRLFREFALPCRSVCLSVRTIVFSRAHLFFIAPGLLLLWYTALRSVCLVVCVPGVFVPLHLYPCASVASFRLFAMVLSLRVRALRAFTVRRFVPPLKAKTVQRSCL